MCFHILVSVDVFCNVFSSGLMYENLSGVSIATLGSREITIFASPATHIFGDELNGIAVFIIASN